MRLGVAHHFGWAIVVAASDDHRVVDRRRIRLVEPGVAAAPIHTDGKALGDSALADLVAEVRASAERATALELEELAASLPGRVVSLSLRAWPADFPTELDTLRRAPYEARADSVMYRQVLAGAAEARGWELHLFDAKTVEQEAVARLGPAAAATTFARPRADLGPPWGKDHRMALAATILAG